MKLIALASIYAGAGRIQAGEKFDSAKVKISDDDAKVLIDGGFAKLDEDEAAPKPSKAEQKAKADAEAKEKAEAEAKAKADAEAAGKGANGG